MSATVKKKMCWNCEASVSLQEENCPYCAVYLGPASGTDFEEEENTILSPPYKMEEVAEETEELPAAPYATEEQEEIEEAIDYSDVQDGVKEVAIPMALMTGGTLFFLFGLVLFLFSQGGIFTLSWNGDYWYFYQLLAIPMLGLGWWYLQNMDDNHASESK